LKNLNLEIQKQNQEKQKKKASKTQKSKKTSVPIATDVPSSSEKLKDLYPMKNLEKQPLTKQLTVVVINEGSSSDFDSSTPSETNKSIYVSESEQDSSDAYLDISLSSNSEQADITEILMTEPAKTSDPYASEYDSETNQPLVQPFVQTNSPQSKTTSNGPLFTVDDISIPKRIARLNEFRAWINTQLSKRVSLRQTLTEFHFRFTGALNDWYTIMGEYRQLQLVQLSYSDFFYFLYREFVWDPVLLHNKFRT
jgi:hypothetical protein